jgi:NAD(P)-dependent dehydrogenase (short-subunit alcohol dehydrogenase family)
MVDWRIMKELTDNISLAGQVAVVTGGGRGIGRAAAIGLATAGASVAVSARTEEQIAETVRLIEEAGGRAAAFATDVSDPASVEKLVADTTERFGPIDLLVNNAAAPGSAGRDWENDPDQWWRTIEVNVRGPYLCSRAVLPGMIERRRGRIINVSSSSAYLTSPYNSAYTTSKAAFFSMTRSLAEATKEYGIGVFNYVPGLVRTELVEYMSGPKMPEPGKRGMLAALGTDLQVEPELSAEGIVYLASGQADAASGRYLDVRWGIPEMVARVAESGDEELFTLQLRK